MNAGVRIHPNFSLFVCLSPWLFSETKGFKYLTPITDFVASGK